MCLVPTISFSLQTGYVAGEDVKKRKQILDLIFEMENLSRDTGQCVFRRLDFFTHHSQASPFPFLSHQLFSLKLYSVLHHTVTIL